MSTDKRASLAAAPDRPAIRGELARLLASSEFASSPRLARLLRHVVECTLEGAHGELKEYALGLAVFDRPASFDPRTDTIVRVHARRLRARLREHYAGAGRDSALRIELPKGHYVASFGWAQVTQPAAPTPTKDPVLAVLPFDNLSADEDLLFFSDGVSEEILQTVSKATRMRVIGRSSSFQFRGRDKAARRVARELGCNYVLDGSVRRSGARVRVSAQLIECESETTLWSDRFDRDLSDVFALQDEIAAAIARALQVSFSPSAGATGIDQVAYELYLRAKASVSNWLGARDGALLEQTVARAPRFSQAWAALAVTRATEASLERTAERIAPLRTRAIEAAEAALSLDPQNGAAHIALGIVEPICGRFRERDELAAKALQLAPNDPLVLFWAFRWSRSVGRLRRSLECISRAFELDPLWPQAVHQYASALATDGQDDEASRIWDQALERWPYVGYLVPAQVQMAALIGDWPRVDALRIAIEAKGVPENRYLVRALRDAENARHWGAELTERLRRRLCQELEASGTLRLGQPFACQVGLADTVYALFERARFEHLFEPHGRLPDGEWDTWVLFMRGGDAMRRDARFVRLCARLGMCDYWAETDRWPDCAADLAPYYDFRAEARRQVS